MAVTARDAVQQLRDAINTVRGACGADPNCRDLLKACASCEDAALTVSYGNQSETAPQQVLQDALDKAESALSSAEKAVGQMFGGSVKDAPDDDGDEAAKPASNLKDAGSKAREAFAAKRRYESASAGKAA